MKDKWGNEPGILAWQYYYISDNKFRDEAQEYAYELYRQDKLLELEISADEINSNDGLFHLKEDERC